jgi:hypothetical protein
MHADSSNTWVSLQGQGQFEEEKMKNLNQKMKVSQPQGECGKLFLL